MNRLVLFLLLAPVTLCAQQRPLVDSLLARTRAAEPLKTRIRAFNSLAWEFGRTDSARAMTYAEQARRLAEPAGDLSGLAAYYRNAGQVYAYKNGVSRAIVSYKRSNEYYSRLNDENEIANNYNYMGMAHRLVGQRQEAAVYFKLAEPIHKRLNRQMELSVEYGNLGAVYAELSEHSAAVNYYLQAVAIFEKLGKSKEGAPTYTNLGNLLRDMKNTRDAAKYYDKAIGILKTQSDPINLGIAYLNYAILYTGIPDYGRAKTTFNLALEIFDKANFKRGVQVCYNNLGAIMIRQNEFREAIPLLERSIKISEEAHNFAGLAMVQQNIGFAYTRLGQFAAAGEWLDKAEQSAKTYKSDLNTFGEIYNHRSVLDSSRGDFKSAFENRVKYLAIKDSLLNANLSKQINELNTKYETEKKQEQIELLNKQTTIQSLELNNKSLLIDRGNLEIRNKTLDLNHKDILLKKKQLETASKGQQISLLNQENTIQRLSIQRRNTTIGFIAGLLLLTVLLSSLLYNRYKLKQEARLQGEIMKQQEMAGKAIVVAEENERTRIAGDLHDGVGQLFSAVKMNLSGLENRLDLTDPRLRSSFEKTLSLVDESCKEVRNISHQMAPSVLLRSGLVSAVQDFIDRVDDRTLKIRMKVENMDGRLESNTETILFRIMQETLNNVIKHSGATLMEIAIIRKRRELFISMTDNGRGFDMKGGAAFNGIGLKNMRSRAQFLKGTLQVSSAPGDGTVIRVNVPV